MLVASPLSMILVAFLDRNNQRYNLDFTIHPSEARLNCIKLTLKRWEDISLGRMGMLVHLGAIFFPWPNGGVSLHVWRQRLSCAWHVMWPNRHGSFSSYLLMTCNMVKVWAAPCEKIPLEVATIREKLNPAMSSRPLDNFSPIVPCALLIDPMSFGHNFRIHLCSCDHINNYSRKAKMRSLASLKVQLKSAMSSEGSW
ncbi:hypothetical protein F3Y22_tig00111213pilonHSYRG00001 [Hibiscus syriacus]|uniref:Uncharacterized protein n=1 Tax=Hibiscus syriacus TaxID=106335 RepID=A0A6A2YUF4_HIBSY|nr:hypothetical protein F3Y22_tig00111213pilonHSYRG00001 [Hibiscus syriacus]